MPAPTTTIRSDESLRPCGVAHRGSSVDAASAALPVSHRLRVIGRMELLAAQFPPSSALARSRSSILSTLLEAFSGSASTGHT